MIKFVNLETGVLFDTPENYIFWFSGGQSTRIFNTNKIGFISDKASVTVSLPENEVFNLIDISKCNAVDIINDTKYDASYDAVSTKELELAGTEINTSPEYYLYIIYLGAFTTLEGEWIENLLIHPSGEKESSIYKIGIDAYNLDESLYINLSNNGIEIPNIIQKAIYDSNVHEDNIDNILMNRKWKELLSNLWDTLSNRGSYKSLVNSLKWFGYDNNRMKLYELWRHKNNFEIRDINAILGPKYFETLNGVAKTTYIAIQYMMSELGVENGKLVVKKLTNDISREDLMLKIRLLGAFYQKYFMPIHLDLYMATVTDLVISDIPINIKYGAKLSREDFVCNVKMIPNEINNKIFYMDALNPKNNAFVFPDTLFKGEDTIIGVDIDDKIISTDEELATFWKQYSMDNGAIIPIQIKIEGEKIIRSTLRIKSPGQLKWIKVEDNITRNLLKFNLLCVMEGEHEVIIDILTDQAHQYISKSKFLVVNPDDITLKLYTIEHSHEISSATVSYNNNYSSLSRFITAPGTICQAIPVKTNITTGFTGVYLNHLLIIEPNAPTGSMSYIEAHYDKIELNKNKQVFISKEYCFKPEYEKIKDLKDYIYRDDYIFVPEYHRLVPFGDKSNIKFYTIDSTQTLCVRPECIYNHLITDEYEWEFNNVSTGEVFKIKSIMEPFITGSATRVLSNGYYNIKFNYRLRDSMKMYTIELNSAFVKI